jgi:signal-induced proliferation-associated 1 like protein 3
MPPVTVVVPVVVVPVPVEVPVVVVVTPTVPTVPVPVPVLTVIGGVKNPSAGFAVDTKLLKPVPRLVLRVVGATPKPMNPEPKPPRNPLWNALPVNDGLNTPGVVAAGKVKFKLGTVPTNGLRTPVTFESAVMNICGTAAANSVLVLGTACNAANRLMGVVVPVPIVPVPVVPVPVVPVPVVPVPVEIANSAF